MTVIIVLTTRIHFEIVTNVTITINNRRAHSNGSKNNTKTHIQTAAQQSEFMSCIS